MTLRQQISSLEDKKQKLLKKLDIQRSRMFFECGCGRKHQIKTCEIIQTFWYQSPHGCMGGDYWVPGELQIICPDTDHKNRLMFDNYDVEWSQRNDYDYSAEEQFKYMYRHLFKNVILDYNKDKRKFWNNSYFDDNHQKFGLNVKGRVYKKK
jgi:hypothetical protein